MRVYALSIHADYRCRHAGACCTAGWVIPVEARIAARLGVSALPTEGGCAFFDRTAGNLCRIHRDHGHGMLPVACQHFPRVFLIDDRGVHVTLSHFCPTAAGQLFRDDVPLEIVEAPALVPAGLEPEGLDARGALPPVLSSDVLMDLESFASWEREAVGALAAEGRSPEQALRAIASATASVARWRPGNGSLAAAIAEAFGRDRDRARRRAGGEELWRPLRRYIASKIFASWTAYRSDRLSDVVAEARRALRVVRRALERASRRAQRAPDRELLAEAVRQADHRIVHRVQTPHSM